jgi:O-antigen/teichoic acid export membrane protein
MLVVVAASLINALTNLFLTPLNIKYLGVDTYGLIGLISTLQVWFFLLDLGLLFAISRLVASKNQTEFLGNNKNESIIRQVKCYGYICQILAIACTIFFFMGWILIARDAKLPKEVAENFYIIGGLSALSIGYKWVHSYWSCLITNLKYTSHITYITLGSTVIKAAALVLGYFYLDYGVKYYFFVICAALLVETLLFRRALTKYNLTAEYVKISSIYILLKPIMNFGFGMLGISALSIILIYFDRLLVAKYLGLVEFAHYNLAITVAGFFTTVTAPIFTIINPKIIKAYNEGAGPLEKIYSMYTQGIALLAGSSVFFLYFFSYELIYLWTKNEELSLATSKLLVVYAIGTSLNAVLMFPFALQVAAGWTSFSIKKNIIAVTFIIPILIYSIPIYGAIAACWLWVGLHIGYVLFEIPIVHRRILVGYARRWMIKDVGMPVLFSFLIFFFLNHVIRLTLK